MKERRICESEYRLLCVIWDTQPINSMDLSKVCEERIGWKKSTTFTLLRKLCDKGLIKNERALVSIVVPKDEVRAGEAKLFLKQNFDSSMPDLFEAVLKGDELEAGEAEALKKIIDAHTKG